ncbi:MAG TPA: porin family protein [Prolixibacteraceae bacterium]|nr:porin family protein [Prolixibacteraceae bacterium]
MAFLTIAIFSFGGFFDLGIKAGYNSSKLTFNQSAQDIISDAKGGYEVGAFMRTGGKHLYFQPEVLWVEKNTSVEDQQAKIKSVQIPLLAGFRFLNVKVASFHLITGPSVSFSPDVTIDDVKTNLTNSSAWSWKLGAGVDVLIFSLNLRYDWGLTDLNVDNVQKTVLKDGQTFTISLGIKLL